jgi:hypothetical protein
MPELLQRLLHDLPLQAEDPLLSPDTELPVAGPKKPDLVRAFTPLGYDYRGEDGTFTLKRQTSKNLAVDLKLDVGTWSNSVAAFVRGAALRMGRGLRQRCCCRCRLARHLANSRSAAPNTGGRSSTTSPRWSGALIAHLSPKSKP